MHTETKYDKVDDLLPISAYGTHKVPNVALLRSKHHGATSVTLLHSMALRNYNSGEQNKGPFTAEANRS